MADTYAGQWGPESIVGATVTSAVVYASGTTTPITVYTDRTKATTTSNPLATGVSRGTTGIDAQGNITVRADRGSYDLMLNGTLRFPIVIPTDPAEPVKLANAADFAIPGSIPANPIVSYDSSTATFGLVAAGSGSGGGDQIYSPGAGPIVVGDDGLQYRMTVIGGQFVPIVTGLTVPGAPGTPVAAAGNAQAVVSFTPPANNGGTPITSYTATSTPGGFHASGTQPLITVTGLSNGTAYTFTATATNAQGTGPASASSSPVTPALSGATSGIAALQNIYANDDALSLGNTYPFYIGLWNDAANAGDAGGHDRYIDSAGRFCLPFTAGHNASGVGASFILYGSKKPWHGKGQLRLVPGSGVNQQPASGFESGTTLPTNHTNVTLALDGTHVASGTSALKGTVSSTTWTFNYDSDATMNATITAGQTYTITAKIYTPIASRSVTLDGGFFVTAGTGGAVNTTGGTTVALTQNAFTTVSVTATAGASTTGFSLKLYSSGTWANTDTFWVDEVQVETGTTATTWGPAVGDITGWTVDQYAATAVDGVPLFDSAGNTITIADGSYTLCYDWTNTKNASSSGTVVNVNKVDLGNCLARTASTGGGGGGGGGGGSFISVSGKHLVLGADTSWQANGFNAYTMENFCGNTDEKYDDASTISALNTLSRSDGHMILRHECFANFDLTALDKLVAAATTAKFRLILTLADAGNGCGDPSGAGANNTWNSSTFATFCNSGWRGGYSAWIRTVCARYAANPTVMAYDLCNEPSNDANIVNFAAGAAALVHSVAPNQLVLMGTQPPWGYGSDDAGGYARWKQIHQAVRDNTGNQAMACMHEYDGAPNNYGGPFRAPSYHYGISLRGAGELNMPLIVGEYAVERDGGGDPAGQVDAATKKMLSYTTGTDSDSGLGNDGCVGALWWALGKNASTRGGGHDIGIDESMAVAHTIRDFNVPA